MSDLGWLFGWAKQNGIEIPVADNGKTDIPQLLELYEIERQSKSVEKAYGFANKLRKNSAHHIDHAREMGYKNQDEYERAAVEFFNGNNGKLYYSKARKRFYRYDERTGLLATSSNGIIHTFMKRTKKEFERMKGWDKLNEC